MTEVVPSVVDTLVWFFVSATHVSSGAHKNVADAAAVALLHLCKARSKLLETNFLPEIVRDLG